MIASGEWVLLGIRPGGEDICETDSGRHRFHEASTSLGQRVHETANKDPRAAQICNS